MYVLPQSDSVITQDGDLLLKNISTNVSYHCVIHWGNKTYTASQYHIVINQPSMLVY